MPGDRRPGGSKGILRGDMRHSPGPEHAKLNPHATNLTMPPCLTMATLKRKIAQDYMDLISAALQIEGSTQHFLQGVTPR